MTTEDLAYQAHLAAVARVEACHHAEFDGGPEVEEQFAPFCGCLDCVIREALDAAWPFMRQLAIEEYRHEQTHGVLTEAQVLQFKRQLDENPINIDDLGDLGGDQ